jgi:glycine dehydrogenase subunit 2
MIEPTETETKERLDAFVDAMRQIAKEAAEDPDVLRNAPYTRPVRRLDEVRAVKQPVVRARLGVPHGGAADPAGVQPTPADA